ncbi:VOC family protein [Bacillus marinisedimentorum]|uniref:VOC family protein n=1 Tax=Bacillus marinisedimentorum TaxID=1821260 RepID=UPI0009F2465C|nr:VOC family protein [Bacillus marinisedimentorum]
MLNKVCVLTVNVNDMKKALKFYTEVLDFAVSKRYGDKIISLVHNELPIVLEEKGPESTGRRQSVLPGILSADIDRDFELLKSKGAVIIFDEPKPCPPGRYFVIEDPSGNQIEVVEFSD